MSAAAVESFVIEAGLLVRWKIIREIKSVAWSLGLDCSHERAGRSVRFTVAGKPSRISLLKLAIEEYVRRYNAST